MNMRPSRIVIVDSDEKARERLGRALEQKGFVVERFDRAVNAAEALRNSKFSCAIVDVDLADMRGWDAVRILRAVAPRLDVVVTAAENTPEVERQVREANITYYHIKCFDPADLVQAVEELCACPSRAGGNAMQTDSAKVLIVDDDPDFHEALKGILEVSGFQVVSALSKAEGMEKVRAEKPDVIILDVMMESLTAGFHFARELRQDPQLKRIPILSVSAVSEKTGFRFSPLVDQEFFPVDDFIEKPIKAKDLIARLNSLIGRRAQT